MLPRPPSEDLVSRIRATEQQRSAALLRAATDLFVLDGSHDMDQLRRYEMLALHFLPLVGQEDRAFVAGRLCDQGDAPRAVVGLLARDGIAVADPLLRRSAVLDSIDLLAIIATTGSEHHRAIATRDNLGADVLRALKLAGIIAAPARAAEPALPTSPVEGPPRRTAFYYSSTTRDPWRFLALDQKGRRRLIAEIAARPPAADGTAQSSLAADRAFRSILGAARIVGYARSGQLSAIIDTIVESLGLPADLVSLAISDSGGEALAVMLKALRLDDAQARQVLLLASPTGKDTAAFFPLSDLYSGMEPEVAEALVDAWRQAEARARGGAHQPHFADNRPNRTAASPQQAPRESHKDQARRA